MKSLRDYINIVENQQLDEVLSEVAPASYDATVAQAKAAANAPAKPAKPAVDPRAISPEAMKTLNAADKTKSQWVNGERYVFTDPDGTGAKWTLDYSQKPGREVGSTGLSGLFTTGLTKRRAETGYTGAQTVANVGQVGTQKEKQAAQPKAAPTPDPKVLALQKELIAKGATNPDGTPLKADGIMGPNTKAAQEKFGKTATPGADAVLAQPAVAQTPAPAAQTNQAAQPTEWAPTADQAKWLGGSDQQDPIILSRMPGAKPPVTHFKKPEDQETAKRLGFPDTAAAPAAQPTNVGVGIKPPATAPATAPAVPNVNDIVKSKLDAQAPAAPGIKPPSTPAKIGEASTFQNDELNRIVSLVQYR